MARLDDALLDLDAAVRGILPYRPRQQQDAVRRAIARVIQSARAEAAGEFVDPRQQLQAALDRAAAELGWSETIVIVNAAGRRHAGPTTRAS